jgi:hypothetical protein
LEAKGVGAPVISCSYEFSPAAIEEVARGQASAEVAQASFAIVVAETIDCFLIDFSGNLRRIFYRIEIRDERDSDPVIASHTFVSADYDASLAWITEPQVHGSVGAYALEIDGCVAGGIECSKDAVGLFQEQRCLAEKAGCCR